jgi:adenosine deaminase
MVHMLMLSELGNDFENKYGKGPNIALHAGELTMGLVPPEHLTYHVFYAVMAGCARRIGHGVDIVFEHDSASFLNLMKENDIAIEINLTSNEFILGVKGDSHPFNLYKESGVPIVISTDDPGILRTSITEEFARAAYRYNLTYDEVKTIARNSIKYSFLNDDDKERISDAFESKLKDFEDNY